jgi:hypothetical protein
MLKNVMLAACGGILLLCFFREAFKPILNYE